MNKKNGTVFIIFFTMYLLSDIYIPDIFLYLFGGVFGTIAKWIGTTKMFFFLWFIVLFGFVCLHFKVQNHFFKITIIILLWALLYLVDMFFNEIVTLEYSNRFLRYSYIGLSSFFKSIVLTFIYYKGVKSK
jgi:hypothetical protein